MKMVLIDETVLEPRVVDIRPKEANALLEGLMPEMRCPGVTSRIIDGVEYSITHDDEFLFHRRNITAMCENFDEILLGSLIIAGYKDDDDYTDEDDDEDGDWGLRDLTDEECERIIKAWHPVSPEMAERYAQKVHPSLLFMMGSNALHYMV